MASREHERKEALKRELAVARDKLHIPDTRSISHQGKSLLSLAGKLPNNVPKLNLRTLALTAGLSFLLVYLFKPSRKKRRRSKNITSSTHPLLSRQLITWGITAAQPLLRSYVQSFVRSWLTRKAATALLDFTQAPTQKKLAHINIEQEPNPAEEERQDWKTPDPSQW